MATRVQPGEYPSQDEPSDSWHLRKVGVALAGREGDRRHADRLRQTSGVLLTHVSTKQKRAKSSHHDLPTVDCVCLRDVVGRVRPPVAVSSLEPSDLDEAQAPSVAADNLGTCEAPAPSTAISS